MEIRYEFAQNAASLDDVSSGVQAIQEVRGDIDSIFTTLASVYEGEGSTALLQAHQKVSQMMDDALNHIGNTTLQAQDQQAAMQAMDRANAASF